MIEKALYEDLDEILALQKLAYQSEAKIYNDFDIPPLTQTSEEIKKEYENQVFLKAVSNHKIIGSVRGYEKEGICHIGRVIVDPEHQNKGIGKALVKNIEGYFSGCNKYSLFTGKQSLRNLYFYQSLGYRKIREEYVSDKLTLVHLEKINK